MTSASTGPAGDASPSRTTPAASERLLPGLVLAAAGAVAFSGKAIIVKLAYGHGTDAVTVIMLRMLFALPFFVAMAWWAGRGRPALTRADWLGVVGLGFSGYYLSSFLDFLGLQHITASLERLITYLTPTLVLVLGWLLHRKPFTRAQLAGMGVSYTGVLLVFGHELGLDRAGTAWGATLVFLSTVTYALYLSYSGQLVRRLGSLRLVGLATSVACVCCIVQFLLLRPLDVALTVPVPVVWLSVLNATLCTAVPVLLVMMAVERIGPALAAQAGMVGPLSTIALSALLLGEPFTGWVAAGTVLVIAGIWVFTRGAR